MNIQPINQAWIDRERERKMEIERDQT